MGIDAKEKTAHNASVGADAGQSIQKDFDNTITTLETKRNGEIETLEEMCRKMQRMANPRCLHTPTMTELFQTFYRRNRRRHPNSGERPRRWPVRWAWR